MALRVRFLLSTQRVCQNQHGAVLYGVLMVLLLLTIIGVASTKVSNTEVQISTNELIYQQNFYRAEGACMEAAELLEAVADPSTTPPTWLANVPNNVTDTRYASGNLGDPPHPELPFLLIQVSSHSRKESFAGLLWILKAPKFMATPSMAAARHSARGRRPSG